MWLLYGLLVFLWMLFPVSPFHIFSAYWYFRLVAVSPRRLVILNGYSAPSLIFHSPFPIYC